MPPNRLQRRPLPEGGKVNAGGWMHPHELEFHQPAQHLAHRGRAHTDTGRDIARANLAASFGFVDRFDVIFDGWRIHVHRS